MSIIMKKLNILFILLLGVLSLKSQAQCNLPYKPLSAFGTDTTAFIIYNFMDRKDCYKDKTIKEVLKDLNLPVKHDVKFLSPRGSFFTGVTIYIYDRNTVIKLWDNEKDDNAIDIYWEKEINRLDPQYEKVRRSDWDKGFYDYIKDMKIKEINVPIPSYSKYYEKYRPKELKSQDNNPYKRNKSDW